MLMAIMTLKSVDPSDPFCKASGSFVQNPSLGLLMILIFTFG